MNKAIIIEEFGGTDKLQYVDWPVTDPGEGEIQVRHEAIGLNFIDAYFRTGLYKAPLPTVLGKEAAGVVTKIGPGVSDFTEGDRIAYYDPMGSYTGTRNLKAIDALPVPDGVDLETAAAITLKGMTACYLLTMTHKLKKQDTILFHAAAGGVGQIAVQWAKHIGATVIATVGTDEKAEKAHANGADHVIHMRKENFVDCVKDITNGQGVEVVYDSIGKDTFEDSLECLRPLGLMVSFGNSSGPVSVPSLGILAPKSLFLTRPSLSPYYTDQKVKLESAKKLYELTASGVLKIMIGQRFALADAAKAHEALEGRKTIGATILQP
jgi:NADPH2:quinone reductase